MSKRGRQEDGQAVGLAIAVLCGRPAAKGEADGVSLTPLEQQVVALKESVAPHVILMVACGYRVKFYGSDSRAVSRRVGIMCIPGQPFEYSSFPYTRVDLYVHRLVAMGYHVGFADQESAAMRAADGLKSGLFTRTVSQLYSRGTLLPTERVTTNGGTGGGGGWGGGGDGVQPKPDDADANEDGGEGDGAGWSGPQALAASPTTDASELFLCFVNACRFPADGRAAVLVPAGGGDAHDDAAAAPATLPPLQVVLVSFVTQRRLCFEVRGALELEDITQRYDIAELIVLQPPPSTPPRSHGHLAGDATPRTRSTAPLLAALPEAYATVLHGGLALNFGPTASGEEDGKDVSVSGHVCATGQDIDGAIAAYLQPYRLDTVYRLLCARPSTDPGTAASSRTAGSGRRLHLPGPTLRALDVFHSSAGLRGSLVGLLDHCVTPCGSRCLRRWLAAPLCERGDILARQAVLAYLMAGHDQGQVEELLRECVRLGDVEAVLGKLHAERCQVVEFVRLLRMVRSVAALAAQLCDDAAAPHSPPPLLAELLGAVRGPAVERLMRAHSAALRSAATTPLAFFTEGGRPVPNGLRPHIEARERAETALQAELEAARRVLGLPGLEYRTITGTPFLLDVPVGKCGRVPATWLVQTRIKTHVRYHTPVIAEQHVALTAACERLALAAAAAWRHHQRDTVMDAAVLSVLTGVVQALASLDALRALAAVTQQHGYVLPTLVDLPADAAKLAALEAPAVAIAEGRHPVLDQLLPHGYVSCNVRLRAGGAWLLTGPNMGGKSALMRMVGTFVVLAQLGCGVPAESAVLPLFDGVYCRMGASDSILEGASTFLSEMDETSRILRAPALSRSLVLMDELGRGTSSFDGAAVAAATLEYLLDQHATTLFVTHYSYLCDPYLAPDAEQAAEAADSATGGRDVTCYYMGFEESPPGMSAPADTTPSLVFTYKPCRGVTPSSFGVAIGRRAGLPRGVTEAASRMSAAVEREHQAKTDLRELQRFAGA